MSLVVLLGGARSGKSTLAVELAASAGAPVTFIATGEALDDEMAARIAAHRAERPADWATIEEPLELGRALDMVDAVDTCVVDCLTLWVSNRLVQGDDPSALTDAAAACAAQAAARPGLTVAVSNEVGLGIVPDNALARTFRDLAGSAHQRLAEICEEVHFVIAGLPMTLKGPRLTESTTEMPKPE